MLERIDDVIYLFKNKHISRDEAERRILDIVQDELRLRLGKPPINPTTPSWMVYH